MKQECNRAGRFPPLSHFAVAAFAIAMAASGGTAWAADDVAPPGRAIGYAITDIKWALYQTKDGKEECPDGLNVLGPRERFKALFPNGGAGHKYVDGQLKQEAENYFPPASDSFPYYEVKGKMGLGLDLDGQVKPTDFTSPEGKKGIDNQLYRALGCISNYRDGNSIVSFETVYLRKMPVNRIMIELTDVDSLANDDDVTITTYRGLDPLVNDATGDGFVAGGTQRPDMRWGKDFIFTAKAKIVGGVLKTDLLDFRMPSEVAYQEAAYYWLKNARFELTLTSTNAQGLIGGYADIETYHRSRNRKWSTHHQSYGQEVSPALYRAMRRNADGLPDPKTGENTAISAAFSVQMVQVHVLHGTEPTERQLAQGKAAN